MVNQLIEKHGLKIFGGRGGEYYEMKKAQNKQFN